MGIEYSWTPAPVSLETFLETPLSSITSLYLLFSHALNFSDWLDAWLKTKDLRSWSLDSRKLTKNNQITSAFWCDVIGIFRGYFQMRPYREMFPISPGTKMPPFICFILYLFPILLLTTENPITTQLSELQQTQSIKEELIAFIKTTQYKLQC